MNWKRPEAYAARHKDENIRSDSRSGGVFTALSDYVLEQNGAIYGCILTDDFGAIHIRADNKQDRDRMRGSKYIQSRMHDIYKSVKRDLASGMKVLFSGTSCQIAGLKGFLGKDYANLICIDIVCHGVPSPKVWQSYLSWQETKHGVKVKTVDFRNKTDFGWRSHIETLYFENGQTVNSKAFTTLFYGHCILRPSCYKCPYKSVMHPGDITIADYWGIEKAAPELDDNKGVSLVLINDDKGVKAFDEIKDRIIWKETRLENSMQPPLKAPFPEPENREKFWNDYRNKSFDYIAKKYGGIGLKYKIRSILSKIKRKLVK